MISVDDSFDVFNTESQKLESTINASLSKSELSISEIVQTYYQIMNVTSLGNVLKELAGSENTIVTDKIEKTLNFISEKFDSKLHPFIMNQLEHSIRNITKNLQSNTSEKKSKDEIESEAKSYETLREIMSTKEFVIQYNKGLSHD